MEKKRGEGGGKRAQLLFDFGQTSWPDLDQNLDLVHFVMEIVSWVTYYRYHLVQHVWANPNVCANTTYKLRQSEH